MQKIKIAGKSFACPKCGCQDRWEHSTHPKGWICENCDYLLSKELLDHLIQHPKLWPSNEEMNFTVGGFAPKPPEYVKGEVDEERVTIFIQLYSMYELPVSQFSQKLRDELTETVDRFQALDDRLATYKIDM